MRIVDAQVHIGQSIQGAEQTTDDLLRRMERLEIEMAVLVPFRPPDYRYEPQNDLILNACQAAPNRFYGLGRVDARLKSAAGEAERCLNLGLAGIYLHPWEDAIAISDRKMDRILEVCARLRAPVMVEGGYPWVSEPTQIGDLAARFPDVQIIMTNGGQINISGMGQRNARLALEGHANIHMTTTGVYREDFIEEVLTEVDSARVLFGSQSPLFDQDFELHRVLWAHVDDPIKQMVLWDNAQRLFGHFHASHEPLVPAG